MKKNIIIAAIAAASALLLCASCQKQELIEQNNGNASGKTFTATIEQGLTKTTITNEYKVNWVEGDQIDINGSIFSATPDASDATKARLTKVSGSDPTPDYTAVYPASIMVGTQATLPATQTYAAGKFNAPMCAMSSTETLEFKNFCGVLCFALKGTDNVKSIAVTANEQLCGPFEFADATSFSFSGGNEGYTVTLDCGEGVQLSSTDSTNFYVYLPPKDSYTAGMKIVVTSTEGKTFEKTTTTAVKIERNNLYTFDWTASFSPAEPEYVEIGGVKWATKNLGATTVAGSGETCYGDYYAWGEKAPYYEGTGGWPATPTWKSGKTDGYSWLSYCGGLSFTEWSTPPYDATTKILKADFDVAAQILGDGWRMPTSAEFKALYDACLNDSYDTTTNPSGASASVGKGVYWCTSYDGVAGCLFCDGTNKLFFPAAGYGYGITLLDAGSNGNYLSSSLSTVHADEAYYLYFTSINVIKQQGNHRYCGYSVRPVKDAAAPLPAGALSGEFSVSATKKVHFSKGNLYWDGDSFEFEANQYDTQSSWSTSHVSHFFWSKSSSVAYAESYSDSNKSDSDVFFTNAEEETAKSDFSVNGVTGQYRTLSKDEWTYLINKDNNENIRKGKYKCGVKVCEKSNCLVLAPDNFTGTIAASYDATAWASAEAAGLVCLPAAGYRDDSSVRNFGEYGDCWLPTAISTSSANEVAIRSTYVDPTSTGNRSSGYSVRLVTEVK